MSFIFKTLIALSFGLVGTVIKMFGLLFKNIIFIFIAFFALLVIFSFVNIFTNPITLIRSGKEISFDVPSIDGSRLISESLKGTTYVLFFTGSECEKCLKQIKTLEQIKEESGVPIYIVFQENSATVNKIVPLYTNIYTRVVVDPTGVLNKKSYAYFLPHTTVVSKNGKGIADVTGSISVADKKMILNKIAQDINKS